MEGLRRRGSGEFKRANIVYFLSRNGMVEHPHLIRVHHLYCNGVRLRDVKRWLAELRGKDMPSSFSWSYKRRYKSGYVWQDLKDDDLITPISDNEYVLKGSLLQLHSLHNFGFSLDENSKEIGKVVSDHQVLREPKSEPDKLQENDGNASPQPELSRDSPADSGNTDRRMAAKEEGDQQDLRRSLSSRASHVLRNILGCGGADADDAALVPPPQQQQHHHQQSSETDSNSKKSRRSANESWRLSASYKPLGAPNCTQCRRCFDPEKLHLHMKSCRALKGGRGKGKISTGRVPPPMQESRSKGDFSRESLSGHWT